MVATRRASSTASIEQQPRSRTVSWLPGHMASVIPKARSPVAATRAAATLESTPPDIATAITADRGRRSSGRSAATATSGNGGDDRYLVALGDGGFEALGEADIGVIDIDVDELPQTSGIVVETIVEARIGGIEVAEHRSDGVTLDAHLGVAAGEPAEGSRNANGGCH